jgi:hypothetical protein
MPQINGLYKRGYQTPTPVIFSPDGSNILPTLFPGVQYGGGDLNGGNGNGNGNNNRPDGNNPGDGENPSGNPDGGSNGNGSGNGNGGNGSSNGGGGGNSNGGNGGGGSGSNGGNGENGGANGSGSNSISPIPTYDGSASSNPNSGGTIAFNQPAAISGMPEWMAIAIFVGAFMACLLVGFAGYMGYKRVMANKEAKDADAAAIAAEEGTRGTMAMNIGSNGPDSAAYVLPMASTAILASALDSRNNSVNSSASSTETSITQNIHRLLPVDSSHPPPLAALSDTGPEFDKLSLSTDQYDYSQEASADVDSMEMDYSGCSDADSMSSDPSMRYIIMNDESS